MKRHRKTIGFVACIIVFMLLLITLFPSYHQREKRYYSDKSNYISVRGIVETVDYDSDSVYIQICEKSVEFTDTGFIIADQNYRLACEKGLESLLQVGSEVEFVCAPRYFGDGYWIPIVSIVVGDVVLLDFEVGYQNLVNRY